MNYKFRKMNKITKNKNNNERKEQKRREGGGNFQNKHLLILINRKPLRYQTKMANRKSKGKTKNRTEEEMH